MILIAENEQDDQVLGGLTALLNELNVDTDGLKHEDAFAVVFWSANDLDLETEALSYMNKEERIAFLSSIEDSLCAAMRRAGLRTINRALKHAQGGHAHLNARMLRL